MTTNQHEKPAAKKDTFLQGALILTIAGIVVKIIGSINWFILSRVIGGEGIGLYMMAFPLYLLALSVSSAGVPTAISIMTAERLALYDYRGAKKVFHTSLKLMVVTGVCFSLLLYFGARWLIDFHIVRDARAYYAILALAPAVFFVTILASYRGHFQGLQQMTPPAVSQIIEQLVRVATMIIFASLLLPRGIEFGAAGASFGAAPAAFSALIVLLVYSWRMDRKTSQQQGQERQADVPVQSSMQIMKRLITLALPVSFASIMLPIVSNLDLMIVPMRLEVAGYTVEQATELFGYLTGMAVPLINLLTILTASLAISLVPAISEAYTLKDTAKIQQRIRSAMRLSNLITIPGFIGLALLAYPLSTMLYGTEKVGGPLEVLAVSVFLLGIHQVTTGVLQGLGHTYIPVINMIIAAAIKVLLNWVLTAIPSLGILGASWATVADVGIAASLNLAYVQHYTGCSLNLKDTKRITLSALFMGGMIYLSYGFLWHELGNNVIATLLSSAVGALVYGLFIIWFRCVEESEIQRIPLCGRSLAGMLRRAGFLKNHD
ncbi:MAG: polysaccharide biosynthesis protein [Sporomusaceae bacterium]|nr:polysaccharide biosynthesis protein [Sporomusaceae bacterium]